MTIADDQLVRAVDGILAMPVLEGTEGYRAEVAVAVARCAVRAHQRESLAALVPSIELALFGHPDGGLYGDDVTFPVGVLRKALREHWAGIPRDAS